MITYKTRKITIKNDNSNEIKSLFKEGQYFHFCIKSFYTKVKIWVPLKSIHVIDNLTVGKANKSFHSESYILISKKKS